MAASSEFQELIQVLTVRMDRQEKQQEITNDLLLRMLNQQQAMFELQQNFQKSQEGFNERQEKFNERQDQFNIIFLDEIRDTKHEVRDLRQEITTIRDVMLKQYDERLKRLEDFMDGFMRKAS